MDFRWDMLEWKTKRNLEKNSDHRFKKHWKDLGEMQKIAKDHNHWKSLVTAFCATRREEVK